MGSVSSIIYGPHVLIINIYWDLRGGGRCLTRKPELLIYYFLHEKKNSLDSQNAYRLKKKYIHNLKVESYVLLSGNF